MKTKILVTLAILVGLQNGAAWAGCDNRPYQDKSQNGETRREKCVERLVEKILKNNGYPRVSAFDTRCYDTSCKLRIQKFNKNGDVEEVFVGKIGVTFSGNQCYWTERSSSNNAEDQNELFLKTDPGGFVKRPFPLSHCAPTIPTGNDASLNGDSIDGQVNRNFGTAL